jgi:hypothetical protein
VIERSTRSKRDTSMTKTWIRNCRSSWRSRRMLPPQMDHTHITRYKRQAHSHRWVVDIRVSLWDRSFRLEDREAVRVQSEAVMGTPSMSRSRIRDHMQALRTERDTLCPHSLDTPPAHMEAASTIPSHIRTSRVTHLGIQAARDHLSTIENSKTFS